MLAIVAVLVGMWLISSYVVAYRLTRRPKPIADEPPPAAAWAHFSSLRLTTADENELGAWFADGQGGWPAVLLLHGSRCSRGKCLSQAKLLGELGCSVLLISMRAHGDSTGEINDFGYSAREDVVAAVDWLNREHQDKRIIIWGQSMGAAAAVFAAEQLGNRVAGYILECPYCDLRTAVRNRTQVFLAPPFDQIAYAGLLTVSPLVLPDVDRISVIEAAARVPSNARVLILAGSNDRLARSEEATAIKEQLGDRATLLFIEGGGHGNLMQSDPATYQTAVVQFVRELLEPER